MRDQEKRHMWAVLLKTGKLLRWAAWEGYFSPAWGRPRIQTYAKREQARKAARDYGGKAVKVHVTYDW